MIQFELAVLLIGLILLGRKLMAIKADFDEKFVRFDAAIEAIKAKLASGGMTAAEEAQVLADLETHVANLEGVAK